MDTLDIPEYAVSDVKKTTYGDMSHVKQRIAAHIKYLTHPYYVNSRYSWGTPFTVYKRQGERYIPVLDREDVKQIGGDYDRVRKAAYSIVQNA